MSTKALDIIRASNGKQATPDSLGLDQDALDAAANLGAKRLEDFKTYERYYDGDHDTRLTERARQFLERSGFRFCENFTEPVVDVFAERMRVTGFDASVESDENPERDAVLSGWLSDLWERNRMDAVQGIVHTQTAMKGEAFVAVDWDAERSRPRMTWNPPERCKTVYSAERPDEVSYAVKVWNSAAVGPSNPHGSNVSRMNIYRPDRVEKFFRRHNSARGGWARWSDEGDEAWPVPWVDGQGRPLGVAIVHFRNKPLGNGTGRSRLRSVLPMQDELNKLVIDMNAIIDMQGYPQRWIASIDSDNSALTVAPGEVWSVGANDSVGQFAAADAKGVLEAVESTLSRLARRTRTPLHLLTGGDMPSGEALKSAEAGLISGVRDAMTGIGNSWEDVMMLGVRLAETFGALPATFDSAALIVSTQWDDPESRNAKDEAETAMLKREIGVSKATLLTEMGYDPEQEAARREIEAEETAGAFAGFLSQGGPAKDDGTPVKMDG